MSDPVAVGINMDSGKTDFRLQNQKMMLTYKTHICKESYKLWIHEMFDAYKPKFLEIAHEIGDSSGTPYEHSHVLIDWGKAFQSKNARCLDYMEIHPHIKTVKTSSHWRNSVAYLAKEDESLAHLKVKYIPTVDRIWGSDTLEEALVHNVHKPNDVTGVMAIWKMKPKELVPMPYTPHEWQNDMFEKIDKPRSWHDRKIIWIYETKGNTGKSHFALYWSRIDPKRFYYVNQVGGAHNFATIVKTAVAGGWEGHCMFVDLSRADKDHAIYQPLEMLKNGCVTATKYEGGTTDLGGRPHIVVLANWPPDVSQMSLDRWDIYTIDESLNCPGHECYMSLKLRTLNIKSVRAEFARLNSVGPNRGTNAHYRFFDDDDVGQDPDDM